MAGIVPSGINLSLPFINVIGLLPVSPVVGFFQVTRRATVCDPFVNVSLVLIPFPPSRYPPSYWLAAVAPPHKNSFGKLI